MSLKNSALVAVAAAALGYAVAADASPVCEGLLNDLNVTTVGIAEVDIHGRVLVIVGITTEGVEVLRPVCDAKGDVRLYTGPDAAVALAKRANMPADAEVKFVKMARVSSIGDPVLALKNKHKAFKAEDVNAGKSVAAIATKIAAAVGLGWNTASGTPEADEYADLIARQVSIAEWKAYVLARVTALAAALTAAGINPDTYAPL